MSFSVSGGTRYRQGLGPRRKSRPCSAVACIRDDDRDDRHSALDRGRYPSLVIVGRRLSYEAWYSSICRPTPGSRSAGSTRSRPATNSDPAPGRRGYWRGLPCDARRPARLPSPGRSRTRSGPAACRRRVEEGPGVVSLRIIGRASRRLHARPGQFFLWRFLDRQRSGRHIRSRSRPPRPPHRFGSPSRPPATTRSHIGGSARGRGCSPRVRSASSPKSARRCRTSCCSGLRRRNATRIATIAEIEAAPVVGGDAMSTSSFPVGISWNQESAIAARC